MRTTKPWLLLLVVLLHTLPAWALDPARDVDEYTVTRWTMREGLPHNFIQDIAQDGDGFLWVGTWEGAARFNGRSFEIYDPASVPGIDLVGVHALLREADGSLLVGSEKAGVLRFREGRWEPLPGVPGTITGVSLLHRDSTGVLWIGTATSLFRFDGEGRLDEPGRDPALQGKVSHDVLEMADGGVLVANSQGLYRLRDGVVENLGERLGLPALSMRNLLRSRDGALWIGGYGGLWRMQGEHVERMLDKRVEQLLQDRDGNIWILTTADGLMRHADGELRTFTASTDPAWRGESLFEDREGLLWVGTDNGLYRVSDGAVFGFTHANGLRSDYVRVVLQGRDEAVWIGHAAGLDVWRNGRLQRVPLNHDKPDPSVLSLAAARDGGLWLGTFDQGVLKLSGDGEVRMRLDTAQGLPAGLVRTMLEDDDGGIWIGGRNGLSHYRDGRLRSYGIADGLPSAYVQAVYRAPDGMLWIGTQDGIATLDEEGRLGPFAPGAGLPVKSIFDFMADADGGIWVASDHGLLRSRNGRSRLYDHRVGLPHDSVFRVIDDGRGYLWVSSNHGVFRIPRTAFDEIDAGSRARLPVEVLDESDGMPGSQANGATTPAGWRTRDGRLWFPTSSGVAVIDPVVAERQHAAGFPLVFESVRIDGIEAPPRQVHELSASVRRLQIRYAGLSLREPGKLRYRYRMVGFDPAWIEAGTSIEAVYTNLPPGNLRFEVQAMKTPVDWSKAEAVVGAHLSFDRQAPWWMSGWFAALVALALLALAALLYRMGMALRAAGLEREGLLRQLAHQASHDDLTGLPNRREAERYLNDALQRAQAGGQPLAVAMLDVDHFKRVNDEHGHEVGDEMLRHVGALLAEEARDGLFSARLGGEEFLLAAQGAAATPVAFERVRGRIGRIKVVTDTATVHCTASMGMARTDEGVETRRGLLSLADARLYRAKRDGRDRLVSG